MLEIWKSGGPRRMAYGYPTNSNIVYILIQCTVMNMHEHPLIFTYIYMSWNMSLASNWKYEYMKPYTVYIYIIIYITYNLLIIIHIYITIEVYREMLLFFPSPAIRSPSKVSFNAALSSCATGHQWPSALELWRQLPNLELEPDLISYNAPLGTWNPGNSWGFYGFYSDFIGFMGFMGFYGDLIVIEPTKTGRFMGVFGYLT